MLCTSISLILIPSKSVRRVDAPALVFVINVLISAVRFDSIISVAVLSERIGAVASEIALQSDTIFFRMSTKSLKKSLNFLESSLAKGEALRSPHQWRYEGTNPVTYTWSSDNNGVERSKVCCTAVSNFSIALQLRNDSLGSGKIKARLVGEALAMVKWEVVVGCSNVHDSSLYTRPCIILGQVLPPDLLPSSRKQ